MSATHPFIDLKSQYQDIKRTVDERIHAVLEHGQYIMGPEVAELERCLESYTKAKHCIGVGSGTEALLICMMALGIGPGDEVITSPFSFVSGVEMIVLLGATPVYVDIEPDSCLMDAEAIEACITERTKAIVPVSLYGQPADMARINKLAEKHGHIAVIEDAAQSFGAEYHGSKSGNLSRLACTSFFPSKPLGCYGDGGAIFTSDGALAEQCRRLRVHGQDGRYNHLNVGLCGRLDTLQAAILLAKMERFEAEVERRMAIGELYLAQLREKAPNVRLLSIREGRTSVWAQMTVMVENRDAVQRMLKEQGIATAVHYPLALNEQPAYRDIAGNHPTPNASAAAKHVMSLPMHPYLEEEHIRFIAEQVGRATG